MTGLSVGTPVPTAWRYQPTSPFPFSCLGSVPDITPCLSAQHSKHLLFLNYSVIYGCAVLVIRAKQERESDMEQFQMKRNMPQTWGNLSLKNSSSGRRKILCNMGEREGKVNHRLLAVDKHRLFSQKQ